MSRTPYRKKLIWTTDPDGNFVKRYPTFKERLSNFGWNLLSLVIWPFYHAWLLIVKLARLIFIDRIYTGNNGIIGPGYRTYHTTKFSWGKLSVVLVLISIILFFIFYK